ncbi:MAG: HK97 family phage prohead protease [Desulfobacterales bacterium]|nr:HK97 family phage prohead protease [Desulfobacterales bacterium]
MHKKTMDFNFEIKSSDVQESGVFTGYASTFLGTPDSHGDVIMPGAFTKTLAAGGRNKSGIALLWAHRSDEPIGTWTELVQDKKGLKVTGQLIREIPAGDKAYHLLKNGAVKHMSIGYDAVVHEFDSKKKIRYLKEISLWEISLCVFPALLSARVTGVKSETDLQSALSELGLAQSDAQHLPNLCTACTQAGGLLAQDIKTISNYLTENKYSQNLIADTLALCETHICTKGEACETGWADIAESVKALTSEIAELENEAKESLKTLTEKASEMVSNSANETILENFFRVADQINLKLTRSEQKLSEGLPGLDIDFSKQLSDVAERVAHIERRVREKYGSVSHLQEEAEPQRKPLTALQNYEKCGIFNEPHTGPDFDYLDTKFTRGSGGGHSVTIGYPGGPAN